MGHKPDRPERKVELAIGDGDRLDGPEVESVSDAFEDPRTHGVVDLNEMTHKSDNKAPTRELNSSHRPVGSDAVNECRRRRIPHIIGTKHAPAGVCTNSQNRYIIR